MRAHHATATAYMQAIAALRSDLANLERQAAETRALLQGLCAHAGIAGPAAPPGEPAAPSSGVSPLAVARNDRQRCFTMKHGAKPKTTTAPAKPDLAAAVAEWEKVLASRADAIAQEQRAVREKDPAKLKAAVAAWARAERRAGEILMAFDGRVRPLPGETDRSARERWKLLALERDFEGTLRRRQRRALQQIGASPEKPAPAKAKPSPRPQQAMKISDWREEPDGSRSRTLTAVDGGGAEAP